MALQKSYRKAPWKEKLVMGRRSFFTSVCTYFKSCEQSLGWSRLFDPRSIWNAREKNNRFLHINCHMV